MDKIKIKDNFEIERGEGFLYGVEFLGLHLSSPSRDKTASLYYIYGDAEKKEYIRIPSVFVGEGREVIAIIRRHNAIEEVKVKINLPEEGIVDLIQAYFQQQEEEERRKKEQITKQRLEQLMQQSAYRAVQIKEANKTPEGKHLLEHGEYICNGWRIIILHNYLTRCLNHTIIVTTIRADDRAPKIKAGDLAGLIIGKRGSNIKAISQKYNLKINLI